MNDATDGKPDARTRRDLTEDLVDWLTSGPVVRVVVGAVALVPLWWLKVLKGLVEAWWVARLRSRGVLVTRVRPADGGWCLDGESGVVRSLTGGEVRGGVYYECYDGVGFSPPKYFGILVLSLSAGNMILVSPTELYGDGGAVGVLARELLALGRIRGLRSVRTRYSILLFYLLPLTVPWLLGAWVVWMLRT